MTASRKQQQWQCFKTVKDQVPHLATLQSGWGNGVQLAGVGLIHLFARRQTMVCCKWMCLAALGWPAIAAAAGSLSVCIDISDTIKLVSIYRSVLQSLSQFDCCSRWLGAMPSGTWQHCRDARQVLDELKAGTSKQHCWRQLSGGLPPIPVLCCQQLLRMQHQPKPVQAGLPLYIC